jgi:hypothetical protein
MDTLQNEWESILESHNLSMSRGELYEPLIVRPLHDETYETMLSRIEEPDPWDFERPPLAVPITYMSAEEFAALPVGYGRVW